jgi:hypothetical protein
VYRFSAAASTWTALSPSGTAPSQRESMGFAATPDGMLYVFGGRANGKEREGGSFYAICKCTYFMYIPIMMHYTI